MRATIRPSVALLFALVLSVGVDACGSNTPAGPPASARESPSSAGGPGTARPSGAAGPTEEQIADAIRFRTSTGLRADRPWVVGVASDPAANLEFGVPLTQLEVQELLRRTAAAKTIGPIIQAYGEARPDEYAGLYLDPQHADVVTVLFTGHLEDHVAALRGQAPAGAAFVLREVRHTERDLQALQESLTNELGVESPPAWFAAIPAGLASTSEVVERNVVVLEVSSANPAAASIIASHYGLADMLEVQSDGTGVALVARGTVRGRARDAAGRPVEGLDVTGTSTQQPGLCGSDEMGVSTDADGRFEISCTVGVHVIEVRRQEVAGSALVGQSKPVCVVKDGVAIVEIVVAR
jgi:hypothetical protein